MTAVAALRDQWLAARVERQQEINQRRAGVQAELSACQQDRDRKAAVVRQTLTAHRAEVAAETQLYLTQVQRQRQAQAQRTAAMLQAFDAELRETVAAMRDDHQQQMQAVEQSVAELRAVTQETLAGHTRDRAVMADRQTQQLTEYVDELKASVAVYMDAVATDRQASAVVEQAQRHRDREALSQEVQAMRDDFLVHRQQMQAFRQNLRQSVWGEAVPVAVSAPPPRRPVAQASGLPRPPRTVAKPAARKAPPVAAPPVAVAPAKGEVPTEEAVFNYLQSHTDGARLTEIESTLGINRFQAVDALRSLIQKELIIQKDRTYRIQEEAVL